MEITNSMGKIYRWYAHNPKAAYFNPPTVDRRYALLWFSTSGLHTVKRNQYSDSNIFTKHYAKRHYKIRFDCSGPTAVAFPMLWRFLGIYMNTSSMKPFLTNITRYHFFIIFLGHSADAVKLNLVHHRSWTG